VPSWWSFNKNNLLFNVFLDRIGNYTLTGISCLTPACREAGASNFVRGKVHGIQVVGVRYMKKSLVCELRKIALGEEKT
jgi:hypothetical protein